MRSHATGFTGRSPGWQVVILRGLPERCSVARVRGLAAYSCGGSHGATVFPQCPDGHWPAPCGHL
ncbi:hypothetical protein SZ55_4300 [Pseudomonas sp. FeS53a]|nr:hypothetical protein SZ55_4300 [Pseudomonas sp. FeS53a]